MPRRAAMTAACAATLSACATSSDEGLAVAADPVIEERLVIRPVCPPELLLAIPPREAVPADAVIDMNDSAARWVERDNERSRLIEGRLIDAKEDCPDE